MRIEWTTELDDRLRIPSRDEVWPDYHEASKLPTALALRQAAGFAVSRPEAFVVSRSFRQFSAEGAVVLPDETGGPAELNEVMARRRSVRSLSRPAGLGTVSALLRRSLGPTMIGRDEETGVAVVLRAWPSAGGLYPLDSYLVARAVDGVPAGCYHVNLLAMRLEPVSSPEPAVVLRDGFFWQEFATTAAAAVLLVAVFERGVAKYGERGYRLCLLDAGHAAQNLLLTAEALGLSAVAVGGFDDDALAGALGLDGVHEGVVHTVLVGGR